jgi:hypothetical protein
MSDIVKGEYDFKKDLQKGIDGEEVIIRYMQNLGFTFIDRCNDNRYDFSMMYNDKVYTYELKTDMYCSKGNDTGNIAIEVESRGRPSGISVTHSDFFVTYFPHLGEIWSISTNNLRKLITEQNLPLKEGKGDPGSNTKFYLVKREKFKQNFKVHYI